MTDSATAKFNRFISRILIAAIACGLGVVSPTGGIAVEVAESVRKSEQERIAGVNKAAPSVLAIFAQGGQGGGSGVVISPDGYALSNFHVTNPCGNFMKCGMADGKLYDAVIVGIDPVGDVALIKLFGRDDFPAAEMGDSDKVQVGDWCFAMGNPFLLATDFTPTVTYGVVSGVHRWQEPAGTLLEYADCIQTDAAINPGNSGGPLFDAKGRLIGINGRGSFEKRGRVNVGVGYAISINQIKNFLGHLKSGRIIDHATLGAQVGTSDSGRVVVTNILEDSDAFRRGLRPDDEITSFAGRRIRSANGFKNMLGTLPKGWRVPLTFTREGESFDILVRLQGVHRKEELIDKTESGGTPPEEPRRRQREPQPGEPRPGEPDGKKGDGKDQPDDGEKRRPRLPRLSRVFGEKDNVPEIVKKHYEKGEPGTINAFFNKSAQERLWKGANSLGDFASLSGPWVFSGAMADGRNFQLTIDSTGGKTELPTGDHEMKVAEGLADNPNPPGSGGMLSTLWLWRKYLVDGPKKFGKLEYIGAAPLPGRDGLFDLLVGTAEGVDCHFYFEPAGQIVAIELYSAGNEMDPCEIHFTSYREHEGRMIPAAMEVRFGDRLFGVFMVNKVELGKAAEQ
jgi:S1-C subfamily serine protease